MKLLITVFLVASSVCFAQSITVDEKDIPTDTLQKIKQKNSFENLRSTSPKEWGQAVGIATDGMGCTLWLTFICSLRDTTPRCVKNLALYPYLNSNSYSF